jgi:hypothetical protein
MSLPGFSAEKGLNEDTKLDYGASVRAGAHPGTIEPAVMVYLHLLDHTVWCCPDDGECYSCASY